MPYLQVDLDALDEFQSVSTAAGISIGDVAMGCLRMWKHCWKAKTAHIAKERLCGFFPGDPDRVIRALAASEFVDLPTTRPDIHVRGAEKRLGVAKAQSDAGKKRAGAPRDEKGRLTGPKSPGLAGEVTSSTPAQTQLLHPDIQHPASSIQQKPSSSRKSSAKPPDPRHTPLREKLVGAFRETTGAAYGFNGGRDARAISSLISRGDDQEVITRWVRGLTLKFKPISNIHELDTRWNDLPLAGADPPRQRDWTKGRVGAEEIDKRKLAVGDLSNAF